MATYDSDYARGFISKCAELGIDPRSLMKAAGDVGATLNKLLASELRAWWTYYIGAQLAEGKSRTMIATEFGAHASEELGHADAIITRLQELGLKVTANLAKIVSDSKADAEVPVETAALLKLNADLEATAIDDYTAAIAAIKDKDPATALMLTEHLQKEQEHHHDIEQLATELGVEIGAKTAQAMPAIQPNYMAEAYRRRINGMRTAAPSAMGGSASDALSAQLLNRRFPNASRPPTNVPQEPLPDVERASPPRRFGVPLASMRVPHAPGAVGIPKMRPQQPQQVAQR